MTQSTPRTANTVRATSPEFVSRSIHPTLMRRRNLAGILKLVLMRGPIARTEIVNAMNASSGGITKLTSELIGAGLIKEVAAPEPAAGVGRPQVPLDLDTDSRAVLSVHIGLRYSVVAAVDLRGRVIVQRGLEHGSATATRVLRQTINVLAGVRDELSSRRVVGVGVTSGGVIDHANGVLVTHPGLGWHAVPVRQLVAEGLGLDVVYDNEACGEALGELMYGTRLTVGNLITIFVGGVVEACLVIDRKIIRGANGTAGTLTHLPVDKARGQACTCGRRNCLQAIASNPALLVTGREQGIVGEDATYEDLLQRATDGDRRARRLLTLRAHWVGQAVAILQGLMDPEAILLSGNAIAFDGYLDAVHSGMDQIDPALPKTMVRLATLGNRSTSIAGAALFLDLYFGDPAAYEPQLLNGK